MRRSKRNVQRIDYREFHTRGVKVGNHNQSESNERESNQSNSPNSFKTMDATQQLKIEEAVLREDIDDLIDENEVDKRELSELEIITQRIEQYRTTFRGKHHELKHYLENDYETEYKKLYEDTLSKIKLYIKELKDCKAKEKMVETKCLKIAEYQKDKSTLFKIEEALRNITLLESEFTRELKEEEDEKVVRWDKEFANNVKKFEKIAEKYEEMLVVVSSCHEVNAGIADVGNRYAKLTLLKNKFASTLKNEVMKRELNKHELFKETRLNIKLAKFSGYDSQSDIYTFQSEFEKLYLRTTPKRVIADLLINNFISEPALSLVKGLDDIQEVWKRLKSAYGDTKILLTKKLNQVSKCELTKS